MFAAALSLAAADYGTFAGAFVKCYKDQITDGGYRRWRIP